MARCREDVRALTEFTDRCWCEAQLVWMVNTNGADLLMDSLGRGFRYGLGVLKDQYGTSVVFSVDTTPGGEALA